MTYAQVIGFAFVGMFIFALIGAALLERSKKISNVFMFIAFVCAVACICFGVDLLSGWSDPFQGVDTSKAVSSHRGRGGWVIFIIKYWPYVLIGLGCYVAWFLRDVPKDIIREILRRQKK